MIKLLCEAPLIPFLIFPKTTRVPLPLIVRLELDLNLIPAASSLSLSVIVEIPSITNLTFAFFFITKGRASF